MIMIDRNPYIYENCYMWVTFYICTLHRSLVTSQILALSEVKAIILSGCYGTHLDPYFSSYLEWLA